jgi:hypothetical protein
MIGDIWIGISDLAMLLYNISPYGFWQVIDTTPSSFLRRMKETPRRRIAVTSSLNELPTDQLGNRVFIGDGGDGVTPSAPSLLHQESGQMYKDDVHGFSPAVIIASQTSLRVADKKVIL